MPASNIQVVASPYLTIPSPALARTRDTSISASTEITLNAVTSLIEVTAID